MKIVRKSPISGRLVARNIPVTPEQLAAWQAGALIQEAMPQLSPEDREFILSGISPEEFAATFGEDEV
jgi:hypothetical protein